MTATDASEASRAYSKDNGNETVHGDDVTMLACQRAGVGEEGHYRLEGDLSYSISVVYPLLSFKYSSRCVWLLVEGSSTG